MKGKYLLLGSVLILLVIGGFFGYRFSVLDTTFKEKIYFTYAKTDTGASIPFAVNPTSYQLGPDDTISIKWNRAYLETDLSNFVITHSGIQNTVYEARGITAFPDGGYKYEVRLTEASGVKKYYDGDNNVINEEILTGPFPQLLPIIDDQIGFKITESRSDGYNYPIGKDKSARLSMAFDPDVLIEITNKEVLQFASDTKAVTLKATNNFIPIYANVNLYIEYSTPSGDTGVETYTKSLILPKGTTDIVFDIPIKISGEISIKADVMYKLKQLGEYSGFQTVGEPCQYKFCPTNSCSYDEYQCYNDVEKLFKIAEDSYRTLIVPQPLWIIKDGECPIGYEDEIVIDDEGNETYFCIRADVKELSCVQFGCPVLPGHNYECTSAGVCAETVYIYKDCRTDGCPSGECIQSSTSDDYVCLVTLNNTETVEVEYNCVTNPDICPSETSCEPNSKTCINNVIQEKLVQCSASTDCYRPCQGLVPTCSQNMCEYTGSCTGTTLSCEDFTCPSGSSCISTDTGITCEKGALTDYGLYYLIGAGIIALLIVSLTIVFRRKRK